MNDFIKIFIVVCAVAGSFYAGQNYGFQKVQHSEEYRKLVELKQNFEFQAAEKENLKIKLENILTSQQAQMRGEFISVVAQYLGESWNANDAKSTDDKNAVKEKQMAAVEKPEEKSAPEEKEAREQKIKAEQSTKSEKQKARLKSFEWMLSEAGSKEEILQALGKTRIKQIKDLSQDSKAATAAELQGFSGRYKGQILGADEKPWATMALDLSYSENRPHKKMKIFRDGKEMLSSKESQASNFYKPQGLTALVIEDENTVMQLYKNNVTQQIAGHYYERLVNGTTKSIGSFVLQKIPEFSEE